MGDSTNIPWCDVTINFWSGCTKVSTGCTFCYAEHRDRRHMIEDVDHWGYGAPRLKSKTAVEMALRLNRKPFVCDRCGNRLDGHGETKCGLHYCPYCQCYSHVHRLRVFSLSLGDWLDPEVPIEWLSEMLATIRQCQNLDWLLCTKRPELWVEQIRKARNWLTSRDADTAVWLNEWLPHSETAGMPSTNGSPPQNVWILVSTENQEQFNKRLPHLLRIPAAVHGLSCEPLLGPIDLDVVENGAESDLERSWPKPTENGMLIDWVIAGGESGASARRLETAWITDIIHQCESARVPCFVKQLGGNLSDADLSFCSTFSGKSMHDKKGGDPSEWPDGFRIRQWPTPRW